MCMFIFLGSIELKVMFNWFKLFIVQVPSTCKILSVQYCIVFLLQSPSLQSASWLYPLGLGNQESLMVSIVRTMSLQDGKAPVPRWISPVNKIKIAEMLHFEGLRYFTES